MISISATLISISPAELSRPFDKHQKSQRTALITMHKLFLGCLIPPRIICNSNPPFICLPPAAVLLSLARVHNGSWLCGSARFSGAEGKKNSAAVSDFLSGRLKALSVRLRVPKPCWALGRWAGTQTDDSGLFITQRKRSASEGPDGIRNDGAAFESWGDTSVPLTVSQAQTSPLNLPLALIRRWR